MDVAIVETLAQISSELLVRELAKRQENVEFPENPPAVKPTCGSGHRGSYNTPLHVVALFIILVLSTLACSFPVIVKRFPRLPVPHRFLFLAKHFGTGVLLATAFVHLLPTAFVSLTDPCLPSFWNETYPAMAGFVAMVSVMVVVAIEMFFATRGAGHSHSSDLSGLGRVNTADDAIDESSGAALMSNAKGIGMRRYRADSMGTLDPGRHGLNGHVGRQRGGSGTSILFEGSRQSPAYAMADVEDNPAEEWRRSQDYEDTTLPDSPQANGSSSPELSRSNGQTPRQKTAEEDQKYQEDKALLQCMLLEAGILFHSIFIGMALSVATGTPFLVLLVAISFHQTFEGLALGSRIAGIAFGPGSVKPWLMAVAYGTTTPIGQAIGLAVHNLYDPASEMGLLMVGMMNAISSGLLLFAGLVQLLAEDFLSDHSYEILYGRKRLQACAAVVSGSLLMAFVGAFA